MTFADVVHEHVAGMVRAQADVIEQICEVAAQARTFGVAHRTIVTLDRDGHPVNHTFEAWMDPEVPYGKIYDYGQTYVNDTA